jgi:hypothetical protein
VKYGGILRYLVYFWIEFSSNYFYHRLKLNQKKRRSILERGREIEMKMTLKKKNNNKRREKERTILKWTTQ